MPFTISKELMDPFVFAWDWTQVIKVKWAPAKLRIIKKVNDNGLDKTETFREIDWLGGDTMMAKYLFPIFSIFYIKEEIIW